MAWFRLSISTSLIASMATCAAACAPSFDEFNVTKTTSDAGPTGVNDAGKLLDEDGGDFVQIDGGESITTGEIPCEDAILGCQGECDRVFDSVLLDEGFHTFNAGYFYDTAGARFTPDGLQFGGGNVEELILGYTTFTDIAGCAVVTIPAKTTNETTHQARFGLRGHMHGVSLNVVGELDALKLVSVNEVDNQLVDVTSAGWADEAMTLTMLVHLDRANIYAEVQNAETKQTFVLRGRYGGQMAPIALSFETNTEAPVLLQRLMAGDPVLELEKRTGAF